MNFVKAAVGAVLVLVAGIQAVIHRSEIISFFRRHLHSIWYTTTHWVPGHFKEALILGGVLVLAAICGYTARNAKAFGFWLVLFVLGWHLFWNTDTGLNWNRESLHLRLPDSIINGTEVAMGIFIVAGFLLARARRGMGG